MTTKHGTNTTMHPGTHQVTVSSQQYLRARESSYALHFCLLPPPPPPPHPPPPRTSISFFLLLFSQTFPQSFDTAEQSFSDLIVRAALYCSKPRGCTSDAGEKKPSLPFPFTPHPTPASPYLTIISNFQGPQTAQELCENRRGRPGLPVPIKLYGFCGHKPPRKKKKKKKDHRQ